jgi:hypothetical protein
MNMGRRKSYFREVRDPGYKFDFYQLLSQSIDLRKLIWRLYPLRCIHSDFIIQCWRSHRRLLQFFSTPKPEFLAFKMKYKD